MKPKLYLAIVVVFGLALSARGAQSTTSTMKAIVVHEYGGPEVLKYEDVPWPEPKENEVLVRVIAAGVNPVDALIRSGKYAKFFGTTLPLIPGRTTTTSGKAMIIRQCEHQGRADCQG